MLKSVQSYPTSQSRGRHRRKRQETRHPGKMAPPAASSAETAHIAQLPCPLEVERVGTDGPTVGIVGAGISGLVAAHSLRACGLEATVFDKARGPGGRTSTRRHDRPLSLGTTEMPFSFDHGAQYFTARDPRFRRYVDSWIEDGVVARWDGRIATVEHGQVEPKQNGPVRYVGIPGMSAVARHLTADLNVTYETRVRDIERSNGGWQLVSDDGKPLGDFDAVAVSTPPAQAEPLLAGAPPLRERAASVRLNPCWAAMMIFERQLDLPFDGAFVKDSPLSWIARNTSKPGRPEDECWVLHGSPEWSARRVDDDGDEVVSALLSAFFTATGLKPQTPLFARAHRWRYSIAKNPLDDGCLWDAGLQIGACGDWCHGSRVEGAFLSGVELACRILGIPSRTSSSSEAFSLNRREVLGRGHPLGASI